MLAKHGYVLQESSLIATALGDSSHKICLVEMDFEQKLLSEHPCLPGALGSKRKLCGLFPSQIVSSKCLDP